MIIFLHGSDTFRSRRQLKKMVDKFKTDRDPEGLNTVSLDCTKEDMPKIMEQILAMPFLAEKRMVVLENILSATKKGDLQEEILKRIEEKTLPEENVYVFWEDKGKPKTKVGKELLARLLKEKYAQEFAELSGAQLSAWISTEIKEKGGNISNHALQFLVGNTGSDMWLINSLIEQLIAYKKIPCSKSSPLDKGEPEGVDSPTLSTSPDPSLSKEGNKKNNEITTEDVNLFIEEQSDDSIFNLVDAIVAKQPKQIYKMIRQQYKIGKDPHYVFTMLLRQFRILLELRDIYDREDNPNSNALAKELGLHPFVVKKSLPFVKKYNIAELKNIHRELLEFDIKLKTGSNDPVLLLDIFVGGLCTA